MKIQNKISRLRMFLIATSVWAIAGCQSHTQEGALVGGVGGAGVGAAIGSQGGNAGKGALIGGAVGALGGAAVGGQMDKNEEDAARDATYREGPRSGGGYYDRDNDPRRNGYYDRDGYWHEK